MFLLFGTRTSQAVVNVVSFVCAYCNTMAEQHVVKRSTKVTLFFVVIAAIMWGFLYSPQHWADGACRHPP